MALTADVDVARKVEDVHRTAINGGDMTKIYDCFMFYNEFELLQIRLHELYDVVDKFILIEGSHTHTGNEKPFYYQQNKDRFSRYADKIEARQAYLPPYGKEPWFGWGREIYQRSAINEALKHLAQPEDVIISGDVDEIPRVSAIKDYLTKSPDDIYCIEEKNYHYNLNTLLETPTLDPKICRYHRVKEVGVSDLRYCHQAIPTKTLYDGGWHLSFMGGTDRIIDKMTAYAHYDIREPRMGEFVSRENVEKCVRERKSLFQRDDLKYIHTTDCSDFPKYVTENLDQFIKAGWIAK